MQHQLGWSSADQYWWLDDIDNGKWFLYFTKINKITWTYNTGYERCIVAVHLSCSAGYAFFVLTVGLFWHVCVLQPYCFLAGFANCCLCVLISSFNYTFALLLAFYIGIGVVFLYCKTLLCHLLSIG